MLMRDSFFGTGGQTIDDVYKYLPSNARLSMARRTLEWRHIAPTAPDTLCKLDQLALLHSTSRWGGADPWVGSSEE
jgi:hypothetical protein